MVTFKDSLIWKNTLGIENDKEFGSEIELLRTSYLKFRENTAILVSRIASALPGLTQHDITHLDSLWDTASLIVSEGFPINPLEGFILGGAILLHDSALCFEAYKNGKIGIRETSQWKDSFAELQGKDTDNEVLKDQADFIAIRELHAIQAESLLNYNWTDPDTNEKIFLLENQNLRKHLGKLIGQIASSHHWDIETLSTKLSIQQNSLPDFPREWRLDPLKIACILRCADAAHIDNLRAPDFLYALIKRNGVSFKHWQAQNRLAKVDIDQSDPLKETLLFTSTIDFTEDDSDSWFVAYDAICLIDKEIKSCNTLLSSREQKLSFKVKSVKGVESPESFSKFVKANGWQPCSAQVHVGNIERLINTLGGEMLYGTGSDLFGIAIRELMQNAIDSINARKYVESETTGQIIIKISEIDSQIWLIVEDNGIGMSERVLTGPLLDFGTSFWTSSLIKSEFPGLRSSSFQSIGKFGIGFYSVFMIADQVVVSSKSWNKGLSETNKLIFKNGFTLRPIIKKGVVDGFHSSTSTQIKLKIKPSFIAKDLMVEIKTNRMGSTNFKVPLSQYLSALCAGISVPIYFVDNELKKTLVHDAINNTSFDKEKWLRDISFSDYRADIQTDSYISKNINRLKFITDNGQIIGLAAINTKITNSQDFLSIATVGGLAHSVHSRDGERYIGFIDFLPKSAKREIGEYSKGEDVITKWANDQLEDLKQIPLNPYEKYCVASSLCSFKTDPTSIAQIFISINNQQLFLTFEQIAELSTSTGIAFLTSDMIPEHMELYHSIRDLPGYALILPLMNSSFLSIKMKDELPFENFSILDCLYRAIINKGYTPSFNKIFNIAQSTLHQNINVLIVNSIKNITAATTQTTCA